MRRLTLLLLTLAPVAVGQFIPDEASRTTRSFPAFTRNGKSTMEARELLLQAWNWKGEKVQGNLFVLFDASTKYFSFMYGDRGANPGEIYLAELLATTAAAYVTDKALMMICPGTSLQIWESSKKASSLDDAEQQAMSTLKAQTSVISRRSGGSWPSPPKLVPLPGLGMEFFIPPMHATARREPRVVSVSPVAGGLEVIIEGEWQEKLTLSPSYEVLKMARVDPQP